MLGAASIAAAQGVRATVSGTVLGPSGAPLGDVLLVITNAAGVERRATTDPDGTFVFGGLQPGTFRLRVDAETAAPWTQEILVATGERRTIQIALQPRTPAAPRSPAPPPSPPAPAAPPAANQPPKPLTNADVIDMVLAKLSDQVVLNAIRTASSRNFDLSPTGLIALKNARVPDAVIAAMQESQKANAAQPSPPAAAQKGDAAAEYRLAIAYRDGTGVAPDVMESNFHFMLAFLLASDLSSSSRLNVYGSKDARRYDREQQTLSGRLTKAQGDQTNARVAQELERLAGQGVVKAQFLMGYFLLTGNGAAFPHDPQKGIEWFRKAADSGFAPAQAELGDAYINGNGVRADASQGFAWIRKAAEQNHAQAQYQLGSAYFTGRGLPQNLKETARWFLAAAAGGHAGAQSFMGSMFENGNQAMGVSQDYAQAVRWSRMAADQGDEAAQLNLAGLYKNGRGVAQDGVEEYKWITIALTRLQKQPDLLPATVRTNWATERDSLAARLTPDQRAEGDRRAREWSAAFAARE